MTGKTSPSPAGMPTTQADTINAHLLAFIKVDSQAIAGLIERLLPGSSAKIATLSQTEVSTAQETIRLSALITFRSRTGLARNKASE
jgi:hypothetical protein